uniref:UPAR/Ly6 domain-containing protein n=1 Tax=Erpetoichthys calabaricus TaxID=27687 RepID=A0A8C4STL3_ERPCA
MWYSLLTVFYFLLQFLFNHLPFDIVFVIMSLHFPIQTFYHFLFFFLLFSGGSYKINKGCVNQNECDAASVFGNIDIGVASTSVKCCDYLLCNINGSTTARLNLLLLGVSYLYSIRSRFVR